MKTLVRSTVLGIFLSLAFIATMIVGFVIALFKLWFYGRTEFIRSCDEQSGPSYLRGYPPL